MTVYQTWKAIKGLHPQGLVFVLTGDSYQAFDGDAETFARSTGNMLLHTFVCGERLPVACFGKQYAHDFTTMLTRRGHVVILAAPREFVPTDMQITTVRTETRSIEENAA